jgi:phosphatidylinositol kinase/protein kinase (PI-3  family)
MLCGKFKEDIWI